MISPAALFNKGSLLLCEWSVCAPWHKIPQSTKKAPNFVEFLPTFIWVVQAHILDDAHEGPRMASEFLAVGDGCGRIAPRSLMEVPTANRDRRSSR
jgi:hypothetical protein